MSDLSPAPVVVIDPPWEDIKPQVNSEAEFLEIASDFGNPLEIVREAISNSVDAQAKNIGIAFTVEEVDGAATLVITIEDDGQGMTRDVLARDFWGLGYSTSRDDRTKIGEKGHGTKIFLRSEEVYVLSHSLHGAFESVCERPMRSLNKRQPYSPKVRQVPKSQDGTGTRIRIAGYSQTRDRHSFKTSYKDSSTGLRSLVRSKRCLTSIRFKDLRIRLMCLDRHEFEILTFGHFFPLKTATSTRFLKSMGQTLQTTS